MKEFEPINNDKLNSNEIKAEAEIKKEIKLMGNQRVVRGHTLYEYNATTFVLSEAIFSEVVPEIDSITNSHAQIVIRKKVTLNEKCFYRQALNFKNAIKVFYKLGFRKFIVNGVFIDLNDNKKNESI